MKISIDKNKRDNYNSKILSFLPNRNISRFNNKSNLNLSKNNISNINSLRNSNSESKDKLFVNSNCENKSNNDDNIQIDNNIQTFRDIRFCLREILNESKNIAESGNEDTGEIRLKCNSFGRNRDKID